ncbi:MAG: PhzF family phenazine biosynthesis protein [Rhodococcus sp.]|nr:PhzF family phenazine biosynthesis protein [Rhodococcus sp. (in: high G+C Gram-positive bacteria)]
MDLEVVHVFIDDDGRHGNALGIVDAASVPPKDYQYIAARSGLATTVFVDMPTDGSDSARASIFGPETEFAFAGQSVVGLAWWLIERGYPIDTVHVSAGPVEIRQSGKLTWAKTLAEWAPHFSLVPLETPKDVANTRARDYPANPHYVWAWADKLDYRVRARMFARELGIEEDEATGAAAVRLTAALRHALLIEQGKGSVLHTMFGTRGWIEIGGRVRAGRTRTL